MSLTLPKLRPLEMVSIPSRYLKDGVINLFKTDKEGFQFLLGTLRIYNWRRLQMHRAVSIPSRYLKDTSPHSASPRRYFVSIPSRYLKDKK